jgi:regulatory protein
MKSKKLTYTFEELKRKMENYCVYQDRCHQEVEKKLKENQVIPEAREVILLHLMEHDFLNEERFAKSFARGKFRIKRWGRQRISGELKMRDISGYNIKQAMKEIDENEYLDVLNEIAQKRIDSVNETNSFKKRRKVFDYLYRKGFETALINEVLNELMR